MFDRYGINSFVYRARLPFHPSRLYELVHDKFVILEPQNEDDEEGSEMEDKNDANDDDDDDDMVSVTASEGDGDGLAVKTDSTSSMSSEDPRDATSSPPTSVSIHDDSPITRFEDLPLEQRLANKKSHPLFKNLLRSKGFVWLATRPKHSGDWSQAGAMLTFSPGMQWFCTLPEEEWPLPPGEGGEEVKRLIEKDYEGEWGDRRQEIVLIGEGLDVDGLTNCLDGCLLKGDEITEWERVMRLDVDDEKREELLCDIFEDGWEEWDDPSLMAGGDEEGHVHGPACSL